MAITLMSTTPEWKAGVAMGERHACTGDPHDRSDARCLALERERDDEARRLSPTHPFGSPAFRAGYEYGYQRVLVRKGEGGASS